MSRWVGKVSREGDPTTLNPTGKFASLTRTFFGIRTRQPRCGKVSLKPHNSEDRLWFLLIRLSAWHSKAQVLSGVFQMNHSFYLDHSFKLEF